MAGRRMPGNFPFDTSNAKCVRERNSTANQLRPDRKTVARNSASQDRLGGSVNKRRFGLLFRLGGGGRQGLRASVAFGLSACKLSSCRRYLGWALCRDSEGL